MARLDLARLLRGGHRRAVEDVLALLPEPARIEDTQGKLLLGASDALGARVPLVAGGAEIGVVVGGPGADRVARIVGHLYEREHEKLALATETLGRYKELTLVYDMSNALSRVLEVDDVARLIVGEAHRFLRASEATLYEVDARTDSLAPLAHAGSPEATPLEAGADAIERRVVRHGQAEFVEHTGDGASVMAAPLRSGEVVFGLLRVRGDASARWTAGDLKLVSSLAANAAAAISHAMLHRDQLRQQALRNQIERFVPASLVDVALEGRGDTREGFAVLFCDIGAITRTLDPGLSPAEVVSAIRGASTTALDVLLAHGASVGTAQGDMLVALFGREPSFSGSAHCALAAASALLRRLDRRFGGPIERPPGIGIARVEPSDGDGTRTFYEGVGVAATLQSAADGRILVDHEVATTLPIEARSAIERVSGPRGMIDVHEVRA